ncbi:MAG: bacteriohemerythrin [Thiotrichales bacterium]
MNILNAHGASKKLVEWSDEYSVGIEEIDEQHKVLVDLLNQMHDAIHQRRGREVTDGILARLGEYTKVHFAVEECLMRLFDYSGYEAHKHEHEQLIAELNQLVEKLKAKNQSISFELLHFLKLWLVKHIQESDREYTAHFISKGVRASYKKKSWLQRLFH